MLYNKYNFKINTFCGDNTRPEISGVFVSPNKTVATDSFTLIEISSVKGNIKDFPTMPNKKALSNFPSFILPKEKAGDVVKLFDGKKNITLPIIENAVVSKRDKHTAEIGKTDLESYNSVMSKVIDGVYPQYEDLLVERGRFIEVNLNPKFLTKIALFLGEFVGSNRTPEIKVKIPIKKDEPVRFYAKNEHGQEAKVILMPIKPDE